MSRVALLLSLSLAACSGGTDSPAGPVDAGTPPASQADAGSSCAPVGSSCQACARSACVGDFLTPNAGPNGCCGQAFPQGFKAYNGFLVGQYFCTRCQSATLTPGRYQHCNSWCGADAGAPPSECLDCANSMTTTKDEEKVREDCRADAECAKYLQCLDACPSAS